jgi:Uma2 family endonuclease
MHASQPDNGSSAENEGKFMDMETFIALAENAGVKIELVAGVPTWEAFPGSRHQLAVQRIERSIEPIPDRDSCGCFELADTYIRFPDGSLKRPDVAIFCQRPPEIDEALDVLPAAVVEVLSKDYEGKDIDVGAPFYLRQGVLDVVLFDPRTLEVIHQRSGWEQRHTSPVVLDLLCGCRVTV